MAKNSAFGKCLGAFLLPLLLVGLCFADPSAAQEQVFTLDQLIQMALETSPELKMADQDIVAARSDLAQAKAGMLPQLDVKAIIGPVEDAKEPIVVPATVNLGGIPTVVGKLQDRDTSTVGFFGRLAFTIAQPLYTFGKISNRRDAAALGIEVQKAARLKKQNEVILNIKELYYAYLIAGQGQKAAAEADDFIQDAGKRIRRLIELKAQNANESDLYRLDAFSAEVKAFATKAESGAHLAHEALRTAVGLPRNAKFRLDRTELPTKPQTLGPEGEYIMTALANRPELTQVKKGAEARKKLVEAAKADLYPSFFAAAVGSVAVAPGREEMDISYFSDDFNNAYAGVIAGAEWHFDLGITKGKLNKARAEYTKTHHAIDFAERNIPLEVMKNYQDALEAQKEFQAFRQASIGSRRWIVVAFSNFDVGVGTARDIFDAIDRYGKNQGEYLHSLYNYHVALARLEYSTAQKME